ncbi:MAG TPA: hypothetical protein VNA11_01165 [Pseudonocardia sp.]|nr:hypothetical protein [Pseudonocardia sp.]
MTEPDRAERAFRDAITELDLPAAPDPAATRRHVRDRRLATLAVVATVLIVAVVGGFAWRDQTAPAPAVAQPAPAQTSPSTDPAPAGWRSEHYRDIRFEVPASWGYAQPPDSSWCADDPRGVLRPEQRTPYVWLDMDYPIRTIGCPEMPSTLQSEHVEARVPGPAEDYAEGEYQGYGRWVVTRFAGSAVLIVTSQDLELARRIVASAAVALDAPCPASSPVAGALGARPPAPTDPEKLAWADSAVLCQYEPAFDPADRELPSLRAVVSLDRRQARDLVDRLTTAPVNQTSCDPPPYEDRPDVAVHVAITVGGSVQTVYVSAAGCPDGSGSAGGIDDGTTLRTLTRNACQALLQPPIVLYSASGEIGNNCLG